MTLLGVVEGRLALAHTVSEALTACWAAFEWASQVADSFAEPGSAHFATWLSVIAPACEGRDAVGFAPSMPGAAAELTGPPDLAGGAEVEAAVMLAAVAAARQARPRGGAGMAREARDAP